MNEFIGSGNGQITMFWVAIVSLLFTIVGLMYSFLSYVKIEKVKQAQERYKELIKMKNIANLLKDLQNYLKKIQLTPGIDNDAKYEINDFQQNISESLGSIDAINRTFFGEKRVIIGPEFYEKGFFDDDFFKDKILCAQYSIKICCKRNTRPFKQGHLHSLVEKAEKGKCEIQILAISSKMSDELLEEIRRSVPNPPKDISEIRTTQERNKEKFIELKMQMKHKDNLKYYETMHFPLFHIIQIDDKMYWGLANYNKMMESSLEVYKNRPYLVFSVYDVFATRMLDKFEKIVEECSEENCY